MTQVANKLISGQTTVAAAGTPAKLTAAGTAVCAVVISPLTGNTNPVVVGGPEVVGAPAGSRKGIVLRPTDASVRLYVNDLSTVYVDVQTNGEGVSWTAESRAF